MTNITIKLLLLVICTIFAALLIKSQNSQTGTLISLAASLILMLFTIKNLSPVIDFILSLSNKAGIENNYLKIILKCVGVCFLGEFTTQLCKDHGENLLGSSTELMCKMSIIVLSLPMYIDIFNLILKLWEN